MSDWEQFARPVSWFLPAGETAAVGDPQPWGRGSIDGLPELSALLSAATVTPVGVAGEAYELLAWGPPDQRRGWLCRPPLGAGGDPVAPVAPVQRRLWTVCGGIVEQFGQPTTWWDNQNEVLTAAAARVQVAEVLADYAWLWEDEGLHVTIDPEEYYAVAVEANGNLTLAHRDDGRLLLFAPDHDFAGVTPLAGSPPYSLLTVDAVPDLTTWIEVCAATWRR